MENQQFNPEVRLDHNERGLLASTAATEGYRIMHRIFRAEVDKFVLDLINTPPDNAKAVWAKHVLAKAAAQFYHQVTSRINEEVVQYTSAPRTTDTPTDATEHVLDMGEIASTFADVYNDRFPEEGIIDES